MSKIMRLTFFISFIFFLSCGDKRETTFPQEKDITESIYAAGYLKSKHQYDVYATVNGVVKHCYVEAGDLVSVGDTLLTIDAEALEIQRRNAALSSAYYSVDNNKEQIQNLENAIRSSRLKMVFDSTQYGRQQRLMNQGAGVEIELEQARLQYENSRLNYENAMIQYSNFKRQLNYNASQSRNNLLLSKVNEADLILRSAIDGKVFSLNYDSGELISPQRPAATIGAKDDFILEMAVDERDILEIKIGQEVLIRLDSYENQIFKGAVTKIYPYMDTQSKSFKIEASFLDPPMTLYPNMSFEANIVTGSKEKALLIPRNYLIRDSLVLIKSGDTVTVKTGLMDFRSVEILEGIELSNEIMNPEE